MVNHVVPPRTSHPLWIALLLAAGCSSTGSRMASHHELPFSRNTSAGKTPALAWSEKLEGKLTDLSVAEISGDSLITEVIEGASANRTRVTLRSANGSRRWQIELDSPVRSQAISANGDWIVVGTYLDDLHRLDARTGKIVWTRKESGFCRPILLEKTSKILCHHDDDATPGIAFGLLDQDGNRIAEHKSQGDVLVLKVSRDHSRVAIGMVKGRVWIFDGTLKKLWEKQLPGEIVDLSVADSAPGSGSAEVAALVNQDSKGQSLMILGAAGRRVEDVRQQIPLQQVELSTDGRWLSTYGNGPRGQIVAQYECEPTLQEKWSHHSPRFADYNQRMDLFGALTVLGFEEITDRTRHSHVVALDRSGSVHWDIPLAGEDGAYLYSRGLSNSRTGLVVGTDDGVISGFTLDP